MFFSAKTEEDSWGISKGIFVLEKLSITGLGVSYEVTFCEFPTR